MAARDFTKFVKEHFVETSNLVGVEVGVLKGDNAQTIKKYLNPKLLVLVDAWNERIERGSSIIETNVEQNTLTRHESHDKNYLHTYQKFLNDTDVIIIRGLSVTVASLLKIAYDFIYIDASHNYDSVLNDIKRWYPLLKDGGVFGGHDYHMEGVSKAVNEFFSNKIFVGNTDNQNAVDWWVIKSG